jgi:NAD-dependent SIR2 family protein deacetylase
MPTAYCVKCQKSVEMKDPKQTTLSDRHHRPAKKGTCPQCNGKVVRIMSSKNP